MVNRNMCLRRNGVKKALRLTKRYNVQCIARSMELMEGFPNPGFEVNFYKNRTYVLMIKVTDIRPFCL